MQAIKEKLNDMSVMRKAKAEAKEEEKAEKELAKARVEVAREVRMAREAEAAMDLHVNKAAEKVAEHGRKHPPHTTASGGHGCDNNSPGGTMLTNPEAAGYSPTDMAYGAGAGNAAGGDTYAYGRDAAAATTEGANSSGGQPTHHNLL